MNPWRSLEGLPKALFVLAIASFVNRMGTMVLVFMVLYLSEHLGFEPETAGAMLAIYGGVGLVTMPISGRLSDRYGARMVATVSMFASGAVLCLFPLAKTLPEVVVATALLAVATEPFRPAAMTMCGHLAPSDRKKSAFALLRLAVNLGMAIGPAIGGVLATVWFPSIFYADGVTSLVAGLILLFSFRGIEGGAADGEKPTSEVPAASAVLRDGAFLRFLFASVLIALVFFQLDAALPLHMTTILELDKSSLGLLFTVNTFIIIFVEVPLNASMERWSFRRAMALGALLVGLGFGAIQWAVGFWSLVGTVVIWTFGEMILFPVGNAWVSEIAPKGRTGLYMSLYTTTFGLGFAIGPWLGTATMQRLGPPTLWTGCVVAGVLTAIVLSTTPEPE